MKALFSFLFAVALSLTSVSGQCDLVFTSTADNNWHDDYIGIAQSEALNFQAQLNQAVADDARVGEEGGFIGRIEAGSAAFQRTVDEVETDHVQIGGPVVPTGEVHDERTGAATQIKHAIRFSAQRIQPCQQLLANIAL